MTGISNARVGVSNGRFWLSYVPAKVTTRGDLGRGGNPVQCSFMTEEGRRYFINFEREREAHAQTQADLQDTHRLWQDRFNFLFGHDEGPSAERLAEYLTKTSTPAEALAMIDADIEAMEAKKWEDFDE